jgi:hypothetical protein
MIRILNIAGRFVVYRPHFAGRPIYRAFALIADAMEYRDINHAMDRR